MIIEYRKISEFNKAKLQQVEFVSEKFLNFIPRGIPDYPSHGKDHSQSIIRLLNNFIDTWSIALIEKELYLLYLGAWVHDIGCVVKRENHNEISADMILKTPFFTSILDKNIITLLQYIVKGHSSQYDLKQVPKDCLGVKLQLLCSIFRVMDACEIDSSKCPKEVFEFIKDLMKPESKEHWIAHMNICGVTFKNPEIVVVVDDLDKSNLLIEHLKKELDSIQDIFNDNNIVIPIIKKVCLFY